MSAKQPLQIIDTTLRDGSHAVRHSFTLEQTRQIAARLDQCRVPIIEVSHGDGIGGSSYTYGFSKEDPFQLIEAAAQSVRNAKIAVLLLPGIGTIADLERAKGCGASVVRVATHCTEADISAQHISAAKQMGLMAVGFLMMVHMLDPEGLAEQAKKMESYGADYINLADSAGALLPEQVKERIEAVRAAVSIPVGFHAHNNLGLAIANSLSAVDAGASYIDATLRGLGAGAGNTQLEVLAGVLRRKGVETGLDFYGLIDASEQAVAPIMLRPQVVDGGSLMLGFAGVYSSFLLHVYSAAEKFHLEPRDILVEVGKRKMIGGQEDLIIDVAYSLSRGETA